MECRPVEQKATLVFFIYVSLHIQKLQVKYLVDNTALSWFSCDSVLHFVLTLSLMSHELCIRTVYASVSDMCFP